jgi:hypothetical protein
MFIATLFTIAKLWKQPRCPTTDERIKKMWYLYTMEFYSGMKSLCSLCIHIYSVLLFSAALSILTFPLSLPLVSPDRLSYAFMSSYYFYYYIIINIMIIIIILGIGSTND